MRLDLRTSQEQLAQRWLIAEWSRDGAWIRGLQTGRPVFRLRGPRPRRARLRRGRTGQRGAAAVVDRDVPGAPGILIRTADTLKALQALAAWARRQWGGPVVGVTGSAGKTTTKDVIAHLLDVKLPVGKTARQLQQPRRACRCRCCACRTRRGRRGDRDRDEPRGRDPRAGRDRAARHRRGHQRGLRARRVLRIRSKASRWPSAN